MNRIKDLRINASVFNAMTRDEKAKYLKEIGAFVNKNKPVIVEVSLDISASQDLALNFETQVAINYDKELKAPFLCKGNNEEASHLKYVFLNNPSSNIIKAGKLIEELDWRLVQEKDGNRKNNLKIIKDILTAIFKSRGRGVYIKDAAAAFLLMGDPVEIIEIKKGLAAIETEDRKIKGLIQSITQSITKFIL